MNALNANPILPQSRAKIEPAICPRPMSEAVQPEDSFNTEKAFYTATVNSVGALAGLASGVTRIIVGGCAGAAQGIVHGIQLQNDQANMAFKVSMAANLAVTGALGGVSGLDFLSLSPAQGALAGAATNVLVGNSEWDRSAGTFQDAVKQNAASWMDQAMLKMPDSIAKGDGALGKVARGAIGEFVGLASGVYTGVTMMGSNFNSGFAWGTQAFDRTAQYMDSTTQYVGSSENQKN